MVLPEHWYFVAYHQRAYVSLVGWHVWLKGRKMPQLISHVSCEELICCWLSSQYSATHNKLQRHLTLPSRFPNIARRGTATGKRRITWVLAECATVEARQGGRLPRA